MKILIVEDEEPAAKKLEASVKHWHSGADVVGATRSVKETSDWLSSHPAPDLILMDIELSDGSSFEIFKRTPVRSPVIFVTAYDAYILEALAHNGIDYLLKPVRQNRLDAALNKYAALRAHFTADYAAIEQAMRPAGQPRKRILAQQGIEFVSIPVEQVAYFLSEFKIVSLVQLDRRRFTVSQTLTELEEQLDPTIFFRINRKYLVHIQAISSFRSFEKGKLQVELNPAVPERVIVSQEKATQFRAWLER